MFKKGFTLIEMLIIVLIIGILAVFAVPQYMKTLEKSRYSEAAEHLRSIYSAEHKYALDHGRYAEKFGDLYLDFSNAAIATSADDSTITVSNYEITLESANDDIPLAKAIRKKGGNNIYGIYKNLQTGDMICEDMLATDNVTCDMFSVSSSVKSCEDGSMVGAGDECVDSRQVECESRGCPWNSETEKCECYK